MTPQAHTIRALVAATLLTLGAHAAMAAPAPTAVEVSIGGIGPGVDAKAFTKVKLLVADALYRGTIDYFDVYGYGKEGGYSACMEKGRFAAAGSFEAFLKGLRSIKPNPSTTAYNINTVEACSYPTPVVTPTP